MGGAGPLQNWVLHSRLLGHFELSSMNHMQEDTEAQAKAIYL